MNKETTAVCVFSAKCAGAFVSVIGSHSLSFVRPGDTLLLVITFRSHNK